MNSTPATSTRASATAKLMAFYLSRDRVLSLVNTEGLPPHVLHALQGKDVPMTSAILGSAVGSYVLGAIASGGIKTLQQLAVENAIQPGTPFIYNGHFYGKGFGYDNKKPALTLTEKLDEPMEGKKLVLEFSKNGLTSLIYSPLPLRDHGRRGNRAVAASTWPWGHRGAYTTRKQVSQVARSK